ncbi:uncharacterized protein BCR38DRAFT_111452 [Pseudomassariella vexata]|uniref:Uncharacterized protein n=1 Tax=Pseudomassariella vexata TaxID=1141098 RepID=A0A1Y2DC40_9PEZI|nr:uncharacterized protein BCR38DRAFT_111452 [Pseudomassariella vexata]ORY56831.1 hypothetical protein BCR38DRAFT_111452 [Pseudomassariella vexata]
MPSRTSRPRLSIFPRVSTTSYTQPSTPRALSPPARIRLRSRLPPSPTLATPPPPPPRPPIAWIWQCHSCLAVYQLAITRRCLICSHIFCTSRDTAPETSASHSRKRRRGTQNCRSQFDYGGWTAWGQWRRKLLGIEVTGPEGQKMRESVFVNRTHDCFTDCDYPCQCAFQHYRVKEEMREKVWLPMVQDEVESDGDKQLDVSRPWARSGDELEMN